MKLSRKLPSWSVEWSNPFAKSSAHTKSLKMSAKRPPLQPRCLRVAVWACLQTKPWAIAMECCGNMNTISNSLAITQKKATVVQGTTTRRGANVRSNPAMQVDQQLYGQFSFCLHASSAKSDQGLHSCRKRHEKVSATGTRKFKNCALYLMRFFCKPSVPLRTNSCP